MSGKLYLVTRADLRHGSQAAQLVHGMATFAREHQAIFEEWESTSNVVVCLAAPDLDALYAISDKADQLYKASDRKFAVSRFNEPDFECELTCVVLEPVEASQELCKGLPLACR